MEHKITSSRCIALVIALGLFGSSAFILEGGLAMNWREKIVMPVLRAVVGKIALSALTREFLTGADVNDSPTASIARPFERSAWVQRAIKNIVEPLSAVTLKFSEDKRGGEREIKDAAFLAFWSRPAKNMSLSEFVEASASWMKLAGECFWLVDASWTEQRFTGSRAPVILARPDRMRHVVQGGELVAWEFTDGAGHRHALLLDEVIHVKTFNPYCDFRGLSEYEAARMATQADYAAGQFARNSMASSGDRGAYVIAKNGVLDDKQREAIMLALREKQRMGQNGSPRPLFLTGDITVEDAKISTPDAAFIATRLENRHEIAIAFGQPASMFDVTASYSVGSASDRYRLIEDASMPLGNKLCDGFELLAQRFFAGRTAAIYAWFAWNEHSVMQAVRRERVTSAKELWGIGVPVSLASEYLDMGLPRFKGDDVSYLPFNVAPAEQLSEETPLDPVVEPPADETPTDKVIRLLSALRRKSPPPAEDKRSARRAALASQHEAARRPAEKAFHAKIKKCLIAARGEVIRKIEAAKAKGIDSRTPEPGHYKAVAADFNFNLATFSGALTAEMRKQSKATLAAAGEEMLAELERDDVFHMAPKAALDFLSQRANRIADAAQEIHDQMGRALSEGIEAGETMDDLADRVRAAFSGIEKGRAMTIAVTETAAAYGVARDAAMRQAGIQYKEWVTAGDGAVRDSHQQAEGQTVAIDEPFDIGGAKLQFPGDPDGPAEEVINCRCVQIAVSKPASENA